ncbi:MAG: FAD:protein FMN transferase [Clostridia bacterium]|nr:FAD:protein FMN transferase [Clostridia bacterium]
MKKILVLFLILLLSLPLTSCKANLQKFTDYSFNSFDTLTTIIGFETQREIFDANCTKIKEWLSEYHKLYDIYKSYKGVTNLYTLNRSQGKAVKVDNKIIDLLLYSMELYLKTDGKLNVAMGSVLSIWHDYRDNGLENPENATLPEKSALQEAALHINFDDVVIDSKAQTVLIKDKKLTLDVGAIAKGYAAQKIAKQMEAAGMTGYILNIGGNVNIIGNRPDGEKWSIGIENPDKQNDNAYIEQLKLSNSMSLVTSGSYQRFYTVNGKNYHHIIDSATLYPAEYFASVSVLCEDSALADGLSTALFCLPYEDGKKLLQGFNNVHALWVTADGNILYSDDFKNYAVQ